MHEWTLTTWLIVIALVILAYLLGSIPSAVWIGKKYYGIDIREHGSKNAGTTNMLRVLGKRAALPVFIIDYLKGYIAVLLMALAPVNEAWDINLRLIGTVAVVLGHIFPIFAGFKGGKGVATILGAGTGIYTPILLMCFGVWCFVFAVWHYVSLASMVAGCCYPFFVTIFMTMSYDPAAPFQSIPFIVFAWLVAVMLVWTHRKNIERLRDGNESKIFLWRKKDTTGNEQKDL
ncbi:MAG: glycerol-3-phosphate 1-O-acyltransferase PlsY [Alistipes sp.]|nr:glycerol-3-phosphate 1-O-acyltransferase PlsY [Alistipes sp.]